MIELLNMDCMDYLKTCKDNEFDLIVTDPPYKVTARGGYTSAGGIMLSEKMRNGSVFEKNSISIDDYIDEFYRVLKDGSHCYIMTNNKNITEFLKVIDRSKFHQIKILIWVKDNKIMSQAYMSQFEYILFLRKGKFKKINDCGSSDVMQFKNPKNKFHPSEKPVELMSTLIKNSSMQGDKVLDPFMGSGTTGFSCQLLNRHFTGVELDSSYFEVAKKRIEQQTAQLDMF